MVGLAVTSFFRATKGGGRMPWLLAITVTLALIASVAGVAAQQSPATEPAQEMDHGHHDGEGTTREPTAEERAAADALVMATRLAVERFSDARAAEAQGYVEITPFSFYGVRAAHFGNPTYVVDGNVLDPERPENLVYLKHDDGRLELLGVMYLAPIGQGSPVGGPLAEWHIHDDLCGSAKPAGVVAILPTGACPSGTSPIS